MYDEQSIRSTRSSSRASSIMAANPPAHGSINAAALLHSVEYMDVDMESIDVAPQQQSSAADEHHESSGSVQPPPSITHESQLETSQPSHVMVSTSEQPTRTSIAMRSGTTRPTQETTSYASSTAAGSDNLSLYASLSNPRGGTSISSSLLPIRPDSDDDDDMEHDMSVQGDAQTQGNTDGLRLRQRRNFDPAVVADLIHDQIVQSLREAVDITPASAEQAPSETNETLQRNHGQDHHHHYYHHHHHHHHDNAQASANVDIETGSSSALNLQAGNPSDHPRATLHRRRLRSSSMRGLLGFQPTDELAADERPNSQTPGSESTANVNTNTPTESDPRLLNGIDRSQFLLSQLPFFIRLIADLSRGIRPPSGTDSEVAGEPTESSGENSPSLESTGSGSTDTDTTFSGTEASSDPTASSPDSGANTRPRRHHTTIRLIQIGGGRARNSAAPTGNESEEGEGRGGQNGHAAEDVGEAVIMFFTETGTENQADMDSNGASDDTETNRTRHRHLSPWVVMTLSGA
ncbi:hypothetical protein BGZ65_007508, partial [Modicella reniformis]